MGAFLLLILLYVLSFVGGFTNGLCEQDFIEFNNRLQVLENHVTQLTDKDKTTQQQLQDQANTILVLQDENRQQKLTIQKLEDCVDSLETRNQGHSPTDDEMNLKIERQSESSVQNKLTDNQDIGKFSTYKDGKPPSHSKGDHSEEGSLCCSDDDQSQSSTRRLQKLPGIQRFNRQFAPDGTVAFMATKVAYQNNATISEKITFDNLRINIGNGWDRARSLFVAPVDGIYMFSVTLLKDKSNNYQELHANIVVNGNVLARIYAEATVGFHGPGSQVVITQLAEGNEVWVHNIDYVNDVHGDDYSSFSGFLIAPVYHKGIP